MSNTFIYTTIINDTREHNATKRLSLNDKRDLVKSTSANFHTGEAYKLKFSIDEFDADLIKAFEPGLFLLQGVNPDQQAIQFSDLGNDDLIADRQVLITPETFNGEVVDNRIGRNKKDFPFLNEAGLMVIDSDDLHEFAKFSKPINNQAELYAALINIDSILANVKMVMASSSSSYISIKNLDTGEFDVWSCFKGNHTIIPVTATENIPYILKTFHTRSINKSYCYVKLSKTTGRARVCSLIDLAMNRSPQPVFCGGPIIEHDDIKQDRQFRTFGNDKGMLDFAKIKKLTKEEESTRDGIVKRLKEKAESTDEARQLQENYRQKRLEKLREAYPDKKDGELLQIIANETEKFEIDESHPIILDDGSEITVKDILNDGKKFHGKGCRHPVETDVEGKCIIYSDQANPVIHSFAHGGEIYKLKRNSVKSELWYVRYEDAVREYDRDHFLIASGKGALVTTIEMNDSIEGDEVKSLYHFDYKSELTCQNNSDLIVAPVFSVDEKNELMIEPKGKPKMLVAAWKDWDERKTYRGFDFAPDGVVRDDNGYEVDNLVNLWTGLGVTPNDNGIDIAPMIWHVKNILCDGDEKLYDYFIKWCAQIVQKPWEKTACVPILKGEKGIGKSLFTVMMKEICGRHGIIISDARGIAGRFNGQLANKIFVVAEEAIFYGDKAVFNMLKELITGSKLNIELKGKDIFTVRNLLNVIFCTNEDFVVPLDDKERRYLAMKVNPAMQDNKEYFDTLVPFTKDKKYQAAFANFLMNVDISEFSSYHDRPETRENKNQRLETLRSASHKEWFLDALNRGYFEGIGCDNDPSWKLELPFRDLKASYVKFTQERKINTYHIITDTSLGKFLGELLVKKRGAVYGFGDLNRLRLKVSELWKLAPEDLGYEEKLAEINDKPIEDNVVVFQSRFENEKYASIKVKNDRLVSNSEVIVH